MDDMGVFYTSIELAPFETERLELADGRVIERLIGNALIYAAGHHDGIHLDGVRGRDDHRVVARPDERANGEVDGHRAAYRADDLGRAVLHATQRVHLCHDGLTQFR